MKLNHEGEYICDCENWEEPVLYPVAELIRCKECKHRPKFIEPKDEDDRGYLLFPDNKCPCHCEDEWYDWMPEDDWYCGNAERKEK